MLNGVPDAMESPGLGRSRAKLGRVRATCGRSRLNQSKSVHARPISAHLSSTTQVRPKSAELATYFMKIKQVGPASTTFRVIPSGFGPDNLQPRNLITHRGMNSAPRAAEHETRIHHPDQGTNDLAYVRTVYSSRCRVCGGVESFRSGSTIMFSQYLDGGQGRRQDDEVDRRSAPSFMMGRCCPIQLQSRSSIVGQFRHKLDEVGAFSAGFGRIWATSGLHPGHLRGRRS